MGTAAVAAVASAAAVLLHCASLSLADAHIDQGELSLVAIMANPEHEAAFSITIVSTLTCSQHLPISVTSCTPCHTCIGHRDYTLRCIFAVDMNSNA